MPSRNVGFDTEGFGGASPVRAALQSSTALGALCWVLVPVAPWHCPPQSPPHDWL